MHYWFENKFLQALRPERRVPVLCPTGEYPE
jgi:hypothetical protein